MSDVARLLIDHTNPAGAAILLGPDDPTSVGADAVIGSTYIKNDTGQWYYKTGAATTSWSAFGSSTGVTSVFGRTGAVAAAANDYTFAQIGSKPTTIGGYGITDLHSSGNAWWLQLGGSGQSIINLILSGNTNPYVQFSDGSYTAYWQMTSGTMQLYHNGSSRMSFAPTANTASFDGARPVVVDSASGFVRVKGDSGGWAMFYGFLGFSGTDRGGFGALGSGDALTYYYIGQYTAEKMRVYPSGNVQIGGSITNMSSAGGPNWWQVYASGSPDSMQLQFGSDNTGYALGIAKNVSGTVTTIARFYDGGSGTNAFRLYGGMEADGSIVIANGQGFYARRSTSNAVIRCLGYDSGTDDLSMVMGGPVFRIRDTGSGVIMSLGGAGGMTVNGTSAGYFFTARDNIAQQFGIYATASAMRIWSGNGIDMMTFNYSSGAINVTTQMSWNPTGNTLLNVNSPAAANYLQFNHQVAGSDKWHVGIQPSSNTFGWYSVGLSALVLQLDYATGNVTAYGQFKDSYGTGMAPLVVSSAVASGVLADRTVWIQV